MADLGLPQVATPPLAYDCYRFSPEQHSEKPDETNYRENLDDLVTEAVQLLTGQRVKSPPEPIPQISQLFGHSERRGLSPKRNRPSSPNIPSAFVPTQPSNELSPKNTCYAQLSMILFWSPTLESLSPQVKEMIWNICLCVPSFQNFQKNSVRDTVFSWMTNPEANRVSILVLFSAVGYLIHHGVLPNVFYYPNTKNPVFPNPPSHLRKREREMIIILLPISPSMHPGVLPLLQIFSWSQRALRLINLACSFKM